VRDAMEPVVAAKALLAFIAQVRDDWTEPAPEG